VADPTGAPTPIRRSRQPAADSATSGRRRRRSWDVFTDSLDGADLPADGPRPGDDGARNGAEAGGAAAGRADAVPVEGSRTDTDQTDRSRTDESRTNGSRSDESRTDAARTDTSRTTEGRRTEGRRTEGRTIEGSVDRSSTDRDGTDGDPTRERPGATPATSDDPTDFGENLGLGDLLAGALAAYRGL
jgi:syndecan 1